MIRSTYARPLFISLVLGGLLSHSAVSQAIPVEAYSGLHWRYVGPFRAGWATVAAGIPAEPNTFYFGGAGGGIWKTEDAGETWQGLMQHEHSSAVGALAIAPSDPRVIYVGTGQETIRWDNMSGDGVYRSSDGGATWKNIGLQATRHIGSILVDPRNPDRVLVAALGHIFDAGSERGVFLTTDGGVSWQHVLFVDDTTGAVDLAADPARPSVVYAAMWEMHSYPWLDYYHPKAGPGSGIYKSEDGGAHWLRLGGQGLPTPPLGRIGLAVPQGSGGKTVYATVVAPGGGSGFYRSDDAGSTWKLMNTDRELANDYFSRVTVAPDNPEVVYVMGRSIHRTLDGGAHFTIFKGAPGGDDYHFLWINPQHPDHMITGSDQGAVVTVDGGRSWSSWENQPTGQFYHAEVDDQFPYHIYSGQQDNGTVGITSMGPYGVIEDRDWHPVGGDERDYMVPKPGNPDIVFGSGLGGHVSRFDDRTRQSVEISPWPVSSYGARPWGLKYRYTWITPLVISPTGSHAMYLGAQVLFRSTDDGNHWDVISPDLSGKVEGTAGCENPDLEQARRCGFGVIYTIAPSPLSSRVIWVGTDDGLIHLTRDGGQHWRNVTPGTVPAWGCIAAISPSPFSARVAYAAVDLHRLGKEAPLILRTTDDGEHWETIIQGLPADDFTSVVRSDPGRRGVLYAGTNRSVYVSFDDGNEWRPLGLNFPTTWVRDLEVHGNDLIAATQGRGIWDLDNVEPLREISASLLSEPAHLFAPSPAWRVCADENRDTPPPPSTPLGQNPPAGAMIDYWLKASSSKPVELSITDAEGRVVRRFSSADSEEHLPANRYFEEGWIGPPQMLSAAAGMHRFVWDLRYPRPPALSYGYSIAGVWQEGTPLEPRGPRVLPGEYKVTLNVNGREYTHPLRVMQDPRTRTSMADLRKQLQLAMEIDSSLGRAVSSFRSIESVVKEGGSIAGSAVVGDSLRLLLRGGSVNLAGVAGVMVGLANAVDRGDVAPAQGVREAYVQYRAELEALLRRWERMTHHAR